jgi:hypothetical protein
MFTTVGSATDQHLHPDFDFVLRGSAFPKLFLKAGFCRPVIFQFLFTLCHNQLKGSPQYMANGDGEETQSLARDRFSGMEI